MMLHLAIMYEHSLRVHAYDKMPDRAVTAAERFLHTRAEVEGIHPRLPWACFVCDTLI
jgi:hypothetical protein